MSENILIFGLEKKPHPYAEEPEAYFEAWGQITIQIACEEKHILIFQTQWDLAELAEWFVEYQDTICNEQLIVNGKIPKENESLSHALSRFYDREFEQYDSNEANYWFETLDGYLERHILRRGLRGSKTPKIVMGLNHGVGEISFLNKDIDWQYKFAMKEFISSFREEIRKFLGDWLHENNNQLFQERILKILKKLNMT